MWFKPDSTFRFYDLMHLRGWKVSEGNWKMNGDTVILNSTNNPYKVSYKGESDSDSLTIFIRPSPFASLRIDTTTYVTSHDGSIKCLRKKEPLIRVGYVGMYSGFIKYDKSKFNKADTLIIELDSTSNSAFHIKNERWLIRNNKLYHKRNEDGIFNEKFFFEKVKLSDLKYRE